MKLLAGLEPNDIRQIAVTIQPVKKIAVTFSGGMDSTLLLYMLLQDREVSQVDTEIHCFTATQCGTKIHSQKVLSLPEFAGKIVHHLDCDNPIDESVKPLTLKLLEDGWTVYGASNAVPLEQIGGRYPPRPVKNPAHPNLILPFMFLFKYHITDAYYKLGIENLINVTHTCTEQEYGECGQCFACREKAWSFDKLGINYTGDKNDK